MPAPVRISEEQLKHLVSLAKHDFSISGRVYIKNHENSGKWVQRWCALYQNFMFYFENEDSTKLSGAIYLEHAVCERLCLTNLKDSENQNCFSISTPTVDGQQQFILRTNTDDECVAWIEAISNCSFAELQSEKEELRKKYIHVMQILESEKTAKWQLLQQCEEQGQLVSSLKAEVAALRKQKTAEAREEESEEIRNIKKVTCTSSLWLHGTIVQYNSCNEEFSLLGCKLILFLSSFLNNNCFQFENAKIFSSKNLITGMYLHLGVV